MRSTASTPRPRCSGALDDLELQAVFPIRVGRTLDRLLVVELGAAGSVCHDAEMETVRLTARQLEAALETRQALDQKLAAERRLAERERLALLGQVSASLAHELKNPMSSMKALAQAVAEDLAREPSLCEQARDVELIVEQIDRLTAVSGDILGFARPASGASSELTALIRSAVTVLEHEARRRGCGIDAELADVGAVRGTPAVWQMIGFNLILNAVQHAPAGSRVQVQLRRRERGLVLETLNRGPAIEAELVARLFEPPTFWATNRRGGATDDGATPEVRLPALTADDPHIAFFTSGSTGAPKAAVLSHGTTVLRSHPGSQLEPRGPALCPYPLFHMAGWTIAMQQWHARSSVVFVANTDATTLTTALGEYQIARFNAVPALWSRLADHVDAGAFPHLRFADTGTSATSVELLRTISDIAPNAHVRVFYGSTEAGNVASLHHDDLLTKPGSCGRPSVLTEVAIADDGELLVSGPLLFDGYLANAEATTAAIRDGWFHTGDRAEIDAEGFLTIVGRLGTVIRSGGESVVPDVIESALLAHPAIDEVTVFGVPDERWGEIVVAAIVATQPLARNELAPLLARHPKYARPRRVLWLDQIPRTAATAQVDRHQLRQLALSEPPEGSTT